MRTRLTLPLALAIALVVPAVTGCGDDAVRGTDESSAQVRQAAPKPIVLWPAPQDPLATAVAAGLEPERKEFVVHHAHAHLDIFFDGRPIVVPAGIGIDIDDPEVQRFRDPVGYGGIKRCRKPCISPLHTHDATGLIHTESKRHEPSTLGQFFAEWGVRLSESCLGERKRCIRDGIAFYVNGKPYRQDPRAIELTDRKEITIVIGTPPAQIPEAADFSTA